MSDQCYDIDGDVGRFLQSPARESYMLDVVEPQATAPPDGGQALQMQDQALPVTLGFGLPSTVAAQHQFVFQAMPVGFEHHSSLQAPAMEIEHHPAPNLDFLQQQFVGPFGFQGQIAGVGPVPAIGTEHPPPPFAFQAPTLPFGFLQSSGKDVDHHHQQASAFGFHSSTGDRQESSFVFQAPAMEDVVQALAPEAYDVPDQPLQHGACIDNSSRVHEMVAEEDRVVSAPASLQPREEEVHSPPIVFEDGFAYIPFIPGTLDCTLCHSAREVLHDTGKSHFLIRTNAYCLAYA